MGEYYTYSNFVAISKTLKRSEHSLPEDSLKCLYQIKKKLNIKELNHMKYVELYEKPKIKKDGDVLNDVYKCLNKITEKTYDKLSKEIMEIMDKLTLEDSETNQKICKKFFEIITNNSLCCGLYAQLYNDLCTKHEEFKTIFKNHIQTYLDEYKTIQHVSPNDDYDNYCLHVKKLDKMKNFTLFLCKSLTYCLCDISDIVEIILYFQERCISTIEEVEYISENEQVIDSLYLIIKEVIDYMLFHESWEIIKRNQQYLKEYKGNGKNNKMKFKLMDIEDIIRKNEE